MSFQAPLFLLALLAVPLLVGALAFERRRRRKYVVRFTATATLRSVLGTTPLWRRYLPAALFLASIAALVVGLARPQRSVAVAIDKASVMLVMDVSGSMQATDVQPSRLDAARDAAKAFVDKVPARLQVGVVAYRAVVDTVQPPTEDHDQARRVLDSLVAEGGTATGDALASALQQLQKVKGRNGKRAPAAIVLLSDGRTTEGEDPVTVAGLARKLRIPVFTVALGSEGASIPSPSGLGRIPVPPDPETLRAIARVTHAKAFQIDDAGQLADVYRKLGSRLGSKRVNQQMTAGFASGGALLLAAALLLSLRWVGRLP
jgi:Ca-activated chloride channel family protein